MSKITAFEVMKIDHPLEEPFEISLGVQRSASNLLVKIETASGAIGHGEGAPLPPVTSETQESAANIAAEMATLVKGMEVAEFRTISKNLANAFPASPSARLAIETSVVDAYCRELDIPMANLFGGPTAPVETDLTVPIVDVDIAAQRAGAAAEEGYRHLKVKTGSDLPNDINRMLAIADSAPDVALKVDANQGWSVSETVRFAEAMADHGIQLDLIEQPVRSDDIAGLRKASRRVPVPIAADESLFNSADAIRLVREEAVDILNLKLGKAGLIDGLNIISIAEAANTDLMIGCMLESAVAIHTAAHVVSGTEAFSYVDLDGNRLLENDVINDVGPMIDISGPGHGIRHPTSQRGNN